VSNCFQLRPNRFIYYLRLKDIGIHSTCAMRDAAWLLASSCFRVSMRLTQEAATKRVGTYSCHAVGARIGQSTLDAEV
jgi:hypothetical protein